MLQSYSELSEDLTQKRAILARFETELAGREGLEQELGAVWKGIRRTGFICKAPRGRRRGGSARQTGNPRRGQPRRVAQRAGPTGGRKRTACDV